MKQKGFTLVELAIVLMIIGLLIGGILKGQELIENARITTFIRQFKAYEAAVWTFKDTYDSLPGDMLSPTTRIPNCSAAFCNVAGDNSGRIASGSNEMYAFWAQLAKTNLISGVNGDATTSATLFPATPWGGAMTLSYAFGTSNGKNGHYLMIYRDLSTAAMLIPPSRAARIDLKADDGLPLRGDIIAYNGTSCIASSAYNETNSAAVCGFMVGQGY